MISSNGFMITPAVGREQFSCLRESESAPDCGIAHPPRAIAECRRLGMSGWPSCTGRRSREPVRRALRELATVSASSSPAKQS